jgi:hypothetical protein
MTTMYLLVVATQIILDMLVNMTVNTEAELQSPFPEQSMLYPGQPLIWHQSPRYPLNPQSHVLFWVVVF